MRVLEVVATLEVDHAGFEEQFALVTERQRRAATSVVAPAVVPAALDHDGLTRGRRGFGRVANVLTANVGATTHCIETEVREARATKERQGGLQIGRAVPERPAGAGGGQPRAR